MIKFLVIFISLKRNDEFLYKGHIIRDDRSAAQFGQHCKDYSAFMDFLNLHCKKLADGQQFRIVDQNIDTCLSLEDFFYGS